MTTDLLAIDFAWQQITPQQMIRAGYLGGSFRYISHDGSKDATPLEIENMHEFGLPVALMFESTAGRAREGKLAGRDDGNFFNDRLSDLAAPDGVCRRTTTDFDGGDECLPYYEGWLEACPRSRFRMRGNYASGYLTRRLKQLGLIDPGGGWQTLSKGFRESTPVNRKFVDVLQRFPTREMPPHTGWVWDENVIYAKDWGAWYPPGFEPGGEDEEDDMGTLRPGEYTVLPLRGKVGAVLLAADFAPTKLRFAVGKGNGEKQGPIQRGPEELAIRRGCKPIPFAADSTWFSLKNEGPNTIGYSVTYG